MGRRAAMLLGVIALTACGGSSGGSAQQVANTFNQFQRAASSGDAATVCSLLTDAERARILHVLATQVGLSGPCPQTLHATLRLFGGHTGQQVSTANVAVNGNTATVGVSATKQVQLTQVGGSWKVSRLPGF